MITAISKEKKTSRGSPNSKPLWKIEGKQTRSGQSGGSNQKQKYSNTTKIGHPSLSGSPRSKSLLQRCRAGSRYLHADARAFPVACFIRVPISVRNDQAPAPQRPTFSKPLGGTTNRLSSERYLRCFRYSATSAAAPACCDVAATYDWA